MNMRNGKPKNIFVNMQIFGVMVDLATKIKGSLFLCIAGVVFSLNARRFRNSVVSFAIENNPWNRYNCYSMGFFMPPSGCSYWKPSPIFNLLNFCGTSIAQVHIEVVSNRSRTIINQQTVFFLSSEFFVSQTCRM